MGEKMYGDGDFTYESRGVINNITESFLRGENAAEKWEKIRDDMSGKIDEEIKRFNKQ
jgi:multiple sugar transport system substrate-binding protein